MRKSGEREEEDVGKSGEREGGGGAASWRLLTWNGKRRCVQAFFVETSVRESFPSIVTVMKSAKWQIIVRVIGLISAPNEPRFAPERT